MQRLPPSRLAPSPPGTPPRRRPRLERSVLVLPSAFTLGNLFLGVWAIVSAARGRTEFAAWLIVLAAIADSLDGRVARATHTGSRFGEELDSLVDAVSFGVAPALVVYFQFLADSGWSWTLSFLYIAAALLRLARFNVVQAGRPKRYFQGLPSPAAAITLVTFPAFAATDMARLWFPERATHHLVVWLLILLAGLMVSTIPYPTVARFGVRTWRERAMTALALVSVVAAVVVPELYFFPVMILYVAFGLVRAVLLGPPERLGPEAVEQNRP